MKETLTRASLMSSFILFVGAILILGFAGSGIKTHNHIAFINGQVFNGDTFVKKNIYSIDGVITFQKPMSVDTVVDVEGKFIIPPFGEAHNHNLGDESNIQKQLKLYLSQGVFYSKNLHYIPGRTQKTLSMVNIPTSVDVLYAHTGLVATGGHVYTLYNNLFNWKVLEEFNSIEELDTRAYMIIDNQEDLEKKWPVLMSYDPGIVKTYLEYSEEFELRKNDPKYADEKGIDPELLPLIVQKAHNQGLRVSVHIESVADFRNAVKAGVDEIAHLPGFRISKFKTVEDYKLTMQDALDAKEKGVEVITTTALSNSMSNEDTALLESIKEVQKANLQMLKDHGVRIALGSDILNSTSVEEVLNLHQLNVFTNLELLKMLCEDTPRNIFPHRKIGLLKEGYEASFLILNENPINTLEGIKNIEMRFKQGEFITM